MWTCCFAYAGPDLFHLNLGIDLRYLRCHHQILLQLHPKVSPGSSSKLRPLYHYPAFSPCLLCPNLASWHLAQHYRCRRIAHLGCFLITFNFSCLWAQTSKANLSSFSVWVGWSLTNLQEPWTAEELCWASEIIVPGEIPVCICSSAYWLATAYNPQLRVKTSWVCV